MNAPTRFTHNTPGIASNETSLTNPLIHNKYTVIEFIGNGKFGNVFKGRNIHTGEYIAVKVDTIINNTRLSVPTIVPFKNTQKTESDNIPDTLVNVSLDSPRPVRNRSNTTGMSSNITYEARILNYLYNKKCKNIPLIYWYGMYKESPALVMPFYEMSVYDMFTRSTQNSSKYKHTIANPNITPNSIMRTILNILVNIHESGVVHRDIKPHNFMIKNQELFLIDFGMATFYVDENFRHIKEPDQPKEHLLGTRKYISIHVHSGKEYSRRDDLISTGYLYLFLQNQLFWDKMYIPKEDVVNIYPETHILHIQNQCIQSAKELYNIEKCLADNYATNPTYAYLRYVYALEFSETPNYYLLRKYFE